MGALQDYRYAGIFEIFRRIVEATTKVGIWPVKSRGGELVG